MAQHEDSSGDALAEARERAVGLLARREHSRLELARKLGQRGFEAGDIETALDQLAADGYQSDTRFCEALVRHRVQAGKGPLHIRAELSRHGIADSVASAALAEAEQELDWLQQAVDVLARRYRGKSPADYRERSKRAAFLQRRGFPAGIARQAVHTEPD